MENVSVVLVTWEKFSNDEKFHLRFYLFLCRYATGRYSNESNISMIDDKDQILCSSSLSTKFSHQRGADPSASNRQWTSQKNIFHLTILHPGFNLSNGFGGSLLGLTTYERLFGEAGARGPQLYLSSIKFQHIVFFGTQIVPRDIKALLMGHPHLSAEFFTYSQWLCLVESRTIALSGANDILEFFYRHECGGQSI